MSEMDKINGANWMSGLCSDLPITAINMPGTHDSATKYVRFKPICNTQNLTIEEQLQIGVKNQKAQIRAFQTRSALFTVIYWVRNYI